MPDEAALRPEAAGGSPPSRLDLIDAAIYADLFDCAVTAEEMWRYSRVAVSRERLLAILADDPELPRALSSRGGLYCLRGRERLLAERGARRLRARALHRRAHRVARVLRRAPFVRGLLLTGSAGADDATADADVDMLVLVAPGRLATVFALLGPASRVLGRSVFCPNHYIATDSLAVDRRRDIYVAHEVAQARALCGEARSLLEANSWISELLPNAVSSDGRPPLREATPTRLQRLLERPLGGALGGALERRLRGLARSRLEHHHLGRNGSVPASVIAELEAGSQLRFHGGIDADELLSRYRHRRAEVAELLA